MSQSTGRVMAVLLNYKTAEMSIDALHNLRKVMRDIPGEVLVVDNDSRDGSYEKLARAIDEIDFSDGLPACRVVQSGHNGGYGYGNNVGIRMALADPEIDFIYILNSDAFPNETAVTELRDFMLATPDAGFAGSHLHGEDGEPHFTQFRFPSYLSEFEGYAGTGPITRLLKRHQVPIFGLPDDEPSQVGWIAGASLIVRREVFEEIGVFDENFFLYFEEVDLCRRALQKGWKTYYVPTSRVVHLGSISTGMTEWTRIPTYWLNSRLYYYNKNYGKPYTVLATLAAVAGCSIARLRQALGGPKVGGPSHFLRDLIGHFVKNIWQPMLPSRCSVAPGAETVEYRS